MKIVITTLLIFLLTSCSNNKDLEGYWYGEFKFNKERSPALLKFENETFIDFFSPYNDTVVYKRSGNKIYFENDSNERREFKFKINNDELSTWEPKSDSLIITLKKRKSDNFIFDFLNDKNLILNLPSGKGLKRTLGHSIQLDKPLYLAYKDDKLTVNFLDTSVTVDSKYHKFLRSKGTYSSEYESSLAVNRISLIGDKDLKISDLDLLRKQLRIAGFSKVYYYLKSESYDKVNVLYSRLRPLTEMEFIEYNTKENSLRPPPPSIIDYLPNFNGELLIVQVNGNKVKVNDTIVLENELGELIKSKILSDKKIAILYYISDNSTYQDFIRFNNVVYNTFYDARGDYLMEKYNIKFRNNFDSTSEEIIEVKRKYPLFFWQIDSLEYKKIKYNL